jgi:hypothetical protein
MPGQNEIFEYVRSDLTDLKQDVKGIRDLTKAVNTLVMEVRELPTKNDLWSWTGSRATRRRRDV